MLGDERVSSNNVRVTTAKGVITLRGQVASVAERQAAEAVARTIEGQQAVVNHLTVVPQAVRTAVERRDDQLVTDVKQAITKEASLRKATIEVRAEKGIVTLTGKAPSACDERSRLRSGPLGVRRARRAERAGVVSKGACRRGEPAVVGPLRETADERDPVRPRWPAKPWAVRSKTDANTPNEGARRVGLSGMDAFA